jgi:hypothetical protein
VSQRGALRFSWPGKKNNCQNDDDPPKREGRYVPRWLLCALETVLLGGIARNLLGSSVGRGGL